MEPPALEEGTVAVLLRDAVVLAATVSSLEGVGLRVVADPARAQVCLSDGGTDQAALTALLVPATPAACAGALKAVVDGRARGAATDADLPLLVTLVRAVSAGVVSLAPRVVSLAGELPALSSRQMAVLQLVASGIPLSEIARRTHVSHATVKRELGSLLAAVGVRSRVELVLTSRALGLLKDVPEEGRTATDAFSLGSR